MGIWKRITGLSIAGLVFVVAQASAWGAPLLNGGFESGDIAGWRFNPANDCEGTLAIDTAVKAEGEYSVRLSNPVPRHLTCIAGLRRTCALCFREFSTS